jgi:hypothetical protein
MSARRPGRPYAGQESTALLACLAFGDPYRLLAVRQIARHVARVRLPNESTSRALADALDCSTRTARRLLRLARPYARPGIL